MSGFFIKVRNAVFAGLFGSLLLLSACATVPEAGGNIEERATERWDLILSGDLDGAYQYLSPGYRSSVSSMQYQRSVLLNRIAWTGARYIESNCTETTCKVQISIDYTLYGGLPGVNSFESTQAVDESWVLSDGNWYFVPK